MTNLSEVIHFQQPVIVLDQARRTQCEVWTRVMGYHRPVTSYNTGKQGEFNERLFFNEPQPS